MKGARAGALLIAATWLGTACNGALTFDPTPRDAAVAEMQAETPPEDAGPPDTVDDGGDAPDQTIMDGGCGDSPASCGWHLTECGPRSDDPCELHCETGRACPGGSCGIGCIAECEQNSSCAITAGDVSHLECNAGASCTLTVGANGNATCVAGSNCRLQCTGHCALNCQTGATCQLRCADATDAQPVTGLTTCP